VEHVRDSPKLNVFAAICKRKLYGPFIFAEQSVRGHSYLDMLQNWSLSHHYLEIWWSCEGVSEMHLLPLQETCWREYGWKWNIA
ncbi:hypothetical protein C0J52_27105, partial [Blattella germanica]